MNYLKATGLLLTGIFLFTQTTELHASDLKKSVCTIKELQPLNKVVEDQLAVTLGFFKCDLPIGISPSNNVSAYVSEYDYPQVEKLFKMGARVEFEFDGTYGGKLTKYDGVHANFTPYPIVRTGIIENGELVTYTFRDVERSINKNVLTTLKDVGQLNLIGDDVSLTLSEVTPGVGQLEITILKKDVDNVGLASLGTIKLPNGKLLTSDNLSFKGESALKIGKLLENAGMLRTRATTTTHNGHTHTTPEGLYVYLAKTGEALFHCANVYTNKPEISACYIHNLRLK